MSAQPGFDWSRDVSLPVSGRSPAARHASATGARMAAETRGRLSRDYLAILEQVGPTGLSDDEAADALGRGRSSINSTRAGLGELVVASGSFEVHHWPGGGVTKRSRWTINRPRMEAL